MELPTIDFEGVLVKPKAGYYHCPFNCSDPRYPSKKWKTEKGFRDHMLVCPNTPKKEILKAKIAETKKQNDEVKLNKFNELKEQTLNSGKIPYKIGQEIYYVREVVVKDTHEWRFNRRVRVRYEAVKAFRAETAIIRLIDFSNSYPEPMTIDDMLKKIVLNGNVTPSMICATYIDALEKAKNEQISYDNWVKECSSYR